MKFSRFVLAREMPCWSTATSFMNCVSRPPSRVTLSIGWNGRGENACKNRREELRRVAKAEVEAMAARAIVKVEQESLDLRTQVVAMGLLSDSAQTFLQTLKPVEEVMHKLDFAAIDKKLELQNADRRKALGYRYDA